MNFLYCHSTTRMKMKKSGVPALVEVHTCYIDPVNLVEHPAIYPPQDRPGRLTNQLEHLKKAIKFILKSNVAKPFRAPVNPIELNIPHYHEVIKFPMDLGTINERLKHQYYWSASEAIEDFHLMLRNCRAFYGRLHAMDRIANELKQMFQRQIADMPEQEIAIEPPSAGTRSKVKSSKKMQSLRRAATAGLITDNQHATRSAKRLRAEHTASGSNFEATATITKTSAQASDSSSLREGAVKPVKITDS